MSTRRSFLTATGAAAALALTGNLPGIDLSVDGVGIPRRTDNRPLFTLGVASGDPMPDAVVIWTRLAPGPLEPFGGMDDRTVTVDWEVAEGETFRRVVRRGTAHARPEYAHTVHVDVRGLRPWRHYFFIAPTAVGRVVLQALDSARYPAAVVGIRDFDIQVRTDPPTDWTTVSEVRGNTQGRVSVSFTPVTSNAVRLVIQDSNDHGYSRIVELEAYSS